MRLGLRIDVDTYRGTKLGVPNLCRILNECSISATFFFCVGPDNMGRHLWRLIRPSFLKKMLRSKAPNLYGWDILFKGTLWQGPIIGEKLGNVIRSASDAGHEIGLHAWDHHDWQSHIDRMDGKRIQRSLTMGVEQLTRIMGRVPTCSAVPSWKCSNQVLIEKNQFPFEYNSDCRGESIFYPLVNGKYLPQPQVPVTLPTYDEVIGRGSISNKNYNDYLLSLLKPNQLNVLTVHAEVEGISCAAMFEQFIRRALKKRVAFVTLGSLLRESNHVDISEIRNSEVKGREGWISFQADCAMLNHDL